MLSFGRSLTVCCLTTALVGAAARADKTEFSDASVAAKLHGSLAHALDTATESELIPVSIVMRDQVPREAIEEASRTPGREARRTAVAQLLQSLADESQGELLALLREAEDKGRAAEVHPLWLHNVVAAHLTADVVLQIVVRDDVAYVNHDERVGIEVIPVEPESEPSALLEIECGVQKMDAPRVWDELGITGRDIIVGVIDTGACITHPDLKDHLWVNPGEIPNNGKDDDGNGLIDDINGWNFWQNNNDVRDSGPGAGHGTHTAGTVLGDGTNGSQTGMAPDALLMTIKIWNNFSGESVLWRGTEYGAEMGASVLSVSYGWPKSRSPDKATWREVYENAMAMGSVTVIAAGNQGSCCPPVDSVTTPGNVPGAVTAGAVDCNDAIASFSSRGPVTWQDVPPFNDHPYPPGMIKPDVSAGGVNTKSLSNDCSGYRNMSGTSMATPHIAGAAALMFESNPDLSPERVKECLMNTAKDLGAPGPDNTYGAGRVNAYEAVLACAGDPEPAACCFSNGSCKNKLRSKCIKRDGRWNFGQECGSFDCPQPGACCIDDSTCEKMLESDCRSRGGDFKGEGEKCKLACPCDLVRRFKAKCNKGGTIQATVIFKNKSRDGEAITIGVGDDLEIEVTIRGRRAKLFTCCFNGPQKISLLDPEGCVDPIVVECPE